MKSIFIVVALLCLLPLPAKSEKSPMLGLGLRTCARYLDDRARESAADAAFARWAMGFMSAANISLINGHGRYHDLGSMSVGDQMAEIRDYCESYPREKFWKAVRHLYQSLPEESSPE